MDEKFVRQYDYKANSNLVLPTDTSLIDKRSSNEGTGEVQSLAGRLAGKMGDKVSSKSTAKLQKQDEDEKQRLKRQLKRSKRDEPSKLKHELLGAKSFSVADVETKDLLYQPKSDITSAAYDLILKYVRKRLGFQHSSIINGAADEVIGTMKDPQLGEELRRSEVDKLLSVDEFLGDDEYNELSNLCKKINDWDVVEGKTKDDLVDEDTTGVGVILSDEDDVSSDDYLSEMRDSDDEVEPEDVPEKEKTENNPDQSGGLDLESVARAYVNIMPKVDMGEPIRKEGYQEYHIAPKKRRTTDNIRLIKVSDLSTLERPAFEKAGITKLNEIQSIIYDRAMSSDKSLLICAPTGAGKTNIAILTMLREILKHTRLDEDGKLQGIDVDKFKIIYVAPIKALVQEIVQNFKKRLGSSPYKLKVEELTGDHQLDQTQISNAQIIVCTPEKWDIVTRKSIDRLYTKQVKLVIFDEIHLLHNERGATLEALVARIKRHKLIEGLHIRIIGLSATLPNYQDVSRFIAPNESVEDSSIYFDSSYRPIPLKQQYIALPDNNKSFRIINDIVYEKVIERLADHAQILVFVHSRPDTFKTADFVKCKALDEHKIGMFLSSESASEDINKVSGVGSKLKELLQFGIGVHHAGLSPNERSCVEELFREKKIRLLVSTATLAWGVNLPARCVIIKGTQVYRQEYGRWTDLESLEVTQMLGRAGRPGYDREGEGIVITQQSKVNFYMSLMTEQLPVESRLIARLSEFVNAECVIGNIESLDDAIDWISQTFLSSRMQTVLYNSDQHLRIYGIDPDSRKNDPKLLLHKRKLAYSAARILDNRGLIVFDATSGAISSTELGRIASDYNCSSRTMKLFYNSIDENSSDIELLRTFSLADEFKDIFVRKGEELDLQGLINQVPFPIDDKRATPGANKVNALLQVYICRINIEGSDLINDMHFIKENAARLARAILEIVLMKGYALVTELAFDLCRKIDKRMTVCHSPLRQFIGSETSDSHLDPTIVNKLERRNYHVDELRLLKCDKLIELLQCDKKTGEKVYKCLKYLPRLKIEASVKPISTSTLRVDLSINPDFNWNDRYHKPTERFWLLVEDVNQELLLHHEIVHVRKSTADYGLSTSFYVPYLKPVHPFYYIRIFPDDWFGCDHHLPLHIEKLALPEESFTKTPPLDLDPQPFKSLENPVFESYYDRKFKGAHFNQIQTQSFKYLYLSDEDLILLASAGSGKTVCAELSIIRNINLRGPSSKSGYIAANAESARFLYEEWRDTFSPDYGVLLLSGNSRYDAGLVDKETTNIVIGDPDTWNILTLLKSKKYRKLMNKFQLFVIDDIHLLHNDSNSSLEWLCTKLRMMTKLTDNPARLVVLGSPVVCADSLKNWLAFERGSKEPILLNYQTSLRPVELQLTIQKFHLYHYPMRLLTMLRPVYRALTLHANHKQVIVFVADSYQAKHVTETIINYARGEKYPLDKPTQRLVDLHDRDLEDALYQGIGYIHQGMHHTDREKVEQLFTGRQIQVLVATVATCWSLRSRPYLTIIMDTQHFNGRECSDYELTDVMKMVGLTGRPLVDHECRCIVMCHTSKAQYYNRFLRESLPVESELPLNLIGFISYEIAVNSVKELNNIYKPYLAHTFFYKRISINPNYYGIVMPNEPEQKSRVFGTFFNDLVNKVALDLEKSDFLVMEGTHENPTFSAGLLARISLEYYINYETLMSYSKWLTTNSKYELRSLELIELMATNTFEFRSITVRYGEHATLKALQRRHRPKEGSQLQNPSFKIKLLILSQYKESDQCEDELSCELKHDRYRILSMSYRLLMAVVDMAWLKDSFSLTKTAIQLSQRISPFKRSSLPNLTMDLNITRNEDRVEILVDVTRESEPFNIEEFKETFSTMPTFMFREEGWSFLINGNHRTDADEPSKFVLFKRVKTPVSGNNQYQLEFSVTEDVAHYSYDLYFMSDFYKSKQDRKVASINLDL